MHSSMAWRSAGGEFFAVMSARRSKASSMVAARVFRSVTCFVLQKSPYALRRDDAFIHRRAQGDASALPAGIPRGRVAAKLRAGDEGRLLRRAGVARLRCVGALGVVQWLCAASASDHPERG